MNFKKSKHVQDSIKIVAVKKRVCLLLAVALFSTFSINAQTTPEPPTPPSTITNSSSSSTSSYSMEVDTDDEKQNSSVSISISNASYKFRASYHKSKNQGVKVMLLNELGKSNLTVKGNTYLWSDSKDADEIFECKLTKGHLKMYLDTEVASKAFVEKINALGKKLKYYISGSDAKKEEAKSAERAKRDLERAEREVAKAKRELERAEREVKRATKQD